MDFRKQLLEMSLTLRAATLSDGKDKTMAMTNVADELEKLARERNFVIPNDQFNLDDSDG